MSKDIPRKTYLKANMGMGKFDIPFDYEEMQATNGLISGTNRRGKTRLGCNIASILETFSWKNVVVDPTGKWREVSDIPTFYTVREQRNYDPVSKEWLYPFPESSMIYDTQLLIPRQQRSFVNQLSLYLWNYQVTTRSKQWVLLTLEESQLYMRNIKGDVAQNLLRICSAGRNQQIRILAIVPDLALIATDFIRLCGQRWHAKLALEENSKRKFNRTYGKDWTEVAIHLDVGCFMYVNTSKEIQKVYCVPCFETKRIPQPFYVPMPTQPKPKSLWQRIKEFFFGTSAYRKTGGQNEAMRVSL